MRISFLLFSLLIFAGARAQGPAGYWLSESKTGFFDGIESMEMRLDPSGGNFSGNIYYIWEHGLYYQEISLEGNIMPGDSVMLKEVALVANRNGVFPNDCQGIFHLRYSRDASTEYLTGVWKKPPGSKYRYPDTKVRFFREIPPGAAWAQPAVTPMKNGAHRVSKKTGAAVSQGQAATGVATAALATAAMGPQLPSGPPPNPDSVRFVAFKARRDTIEMIIPHHADTARLELYDDAIVDSDRVSLFLGDSIVLKNYTLLEKAKVIALPLSLEHREQTLFLYAENLGEIPPNTALMVIYVDDKRYEVRLSSDLKTNALVVFQKLP